jgi:hypothetical protein
VRVGGRREGGCGTAMTGRIGGRRIDRRVWKAIVGPWYRISWNIESINYLSGQNPIGCSPIALMCWTASVQDLEILRDNTGDDLT